jgi:hypothetical protein
MKNSGCSLDPAVVRRDVVRHEVEDQPQAARRSRSRSRRQRFASPPNSS